MLRLSLLLFALLAAGCYDDAGVPAPKNDPLPEANLSLPDLSARCGDTPVRIVQDIVVAGRVTTSDEAGNFFRSVVLQEDGIVAAHEKRTFLQIKNLRKIVPVGFDRHGKTVGAAGKGFNRREIGRASCRERV